MAKNRILFWSLLSIVITLRFTSQAQIITTIAGNGGTAYSGDGGQAQLAQTHTAGGLLVDGAGNMYISDFHGAIRRVSPSGIISTIAGTGVSGYSGDGGPATAAQLGEEPCGTAIDPAGNLYICDYGNNCIRKVSTAGIISTAAGTGIAGYNGDGMVATAAQLHGPMGIWCDASGSIYFSDEFNNRIRKIDASGYISTIAGGATAGYTGDGGLASLALLHDPHFLTADLSGNVYFCDIGNNVVRKISTAGIITTIAGNGIAGFSGDGLPATAAQLNYPDGVAVDGADNLYIAEGNNERIRKVDASGIISTYAGTGSFGFAGDGGPATLAKFYVPSSVTIGPSGSILLVDNTNSRVRMISTQKPHFAGGHSLSLTVCDTVITLDSALSVVDSNKWIRDTCTVLTAPLHGTVAASYVITAMGGLLVPSGLTYTVATGYTGTDSFTVKVSDGFGADTATIHINIPGTPNAGSISGDDTLCGGYIYTFVDTVTGGTWSAANTIASVSSTGVITSTGIGFDTIYYIVNNGCGIDTAFKEVFVMGCPDAVKNISPVEAALEVYPNPNNGSFTVTLSGGAFQVADIIITDVFGRKIKSFTADANRKVEIDLDAAPGIYFINAPGLHRSVMIHIR